MVIKKRVKFTTGLIAALAFVAVYFIQSSIKEHEVLEAHKVWQAERIAKLMDKDASWLNLAGLFWLEEGEFGQQKSGQEKWTFGGAVDNDFVLEGDGVPASLGHFIRKENQVWYQPSSDVPVLVGGNELGNLEIFLKDDEGGYGDPTIITWEQHQWWLINRDSMLGIRVRDMESPIYNNFAGIKSFKYNFDWIVTAQFLSFDTTRSFTYPTVLGTMREEASPGVLVFEKEGQQYEMIPFEREGGSKLFLVFGDETNGADTYEGGRFLYVNKPDETGKTVIDFNRAYNPPCAFSPYSTCPQPLRQNRLAVTVLAGEKMYQKPAEEG